MTARAFAPLLLALALLPAARGQAAVLHVAAAADARPALERLNAAFTAAHPGVSVKVSAGATGQLARQVRQGAPFDLLLGADDHFTAALDRDGLVEPGLRRVYALGRLALWLPDRLGLDPARAGLKTLLDPKVTRVALADPAQAPYGQAAVNALKTAGLYDTLLSKLVYGVNVSQAAQLAATGADAGLISRGQAAALPGGKAWTVPTTLAPALKQEAVVVKGHASPQARAYFNFLFGPQARAAFAAGGFDLP